VIADSGPRSAVGPVRIAPVEISPARRALDVVAGGIALAVSSPFLAVIGLLVRLESPGPAIFRQTRVGAGGRPFTLLKFRSMRCGGGGPDVTAPGDARVTRVGRWLRRSSLDELPQLVNVVRGDMTLVGPRPETPALAARYRPGCAEVFRYRPGITGPGQIRLRDDLVLPPGVDDVQEYYLTEVVPRRVAIDLEFQAMPTFRNTIAVLVETAVYLLR
jgi:lipopolysaccharide/colanic/teichoic acid biosynthesis glycosyltransferase